MTNPTKRIKHKHTLLDLDGFVPTYITQIGNKWSRGSSRLYLKNFGLGVNEWRVMTIIAREPGTTAQRACDILGIDKAAVGRSIALLQDLGFVQVETSVTDRRNRHVSLTKRGWQTHQEILAIALAREQLLLDGLSNEEVKTLIQLLDRVRQNLVRLNLDSDDL